SASGSSGRHEEGSWRQVQSHHQRRQGHAVPAASIGIAGLRGGGCQQRELRDAEAGDGGEGLLTGIRTMKIKGAKAVHYDSGPNITPLVVVVMVILIFLMLAGSFGASAIFLPSSMPIKDKGKGQIDPSKIPKVPDPQLEIFVTSRDSTV